MNECPSFARERRKSYLFLLGSGLILVMLAFDASLFIGSLWWSSALWGCGALFGFCEARTWKLMEKLKEVTSTTTLSARDLAPLIRKIKEIKKTFWRRWNVNVVGIAVAVFCGGLLSGVVDSFARKFAFVLGFGAVGILAPMAVWLGEDYKKLDNFVEEQSLSRRKEEEQSEELKRMAAAPHLDSANDPHLQSYGKLR